MATVRKTRILILAVALAMACGTMVSANGLNLNGTGSKAIGMGGAFIGLADDGSAVFWNPAGLTQAEGPELYLFETNLIPSGTYKLATPLFQIDAQTESKIYPSGAAAYYRPVGEKFVVGIAGYVPAGVGAKWNGADLALLAQNQNVEWESLMAVVSGGPVVAVKLTDKVSLGLSLDINYALLNVKRPGVGQYEENLSAWAPSATLGLLAKPNDKVSFGANLRTPATIKFKGDATMSGVAALAAYGLSVPGTSDAEREATWPLWAGAGVALKPTEKLTITADLQFTQWAKIDDIAVTYSDPVWTAAQQSPLLSAAFSNKFHLSWENKVQVRVGAELVPAEGWALRAGYYYDPSPSPAETLNILLPEATYHAGTVGIGRKAGKLKIDLCLEALFGADENSPLDGVMPGTHGMNILVPNISIGYSF